MRDGVLPQSCNLRVPSMEMRTGMAETNAANPKVGVHASIALYLVALLDVVHIATAFANSSASQRTLGVVIGVCISNIAIVILLVWLAQSARRGKRLVGSFCLLLFLFFGFLFALGMASVVGYTGSSVLLTVQIVFLLTILGALVYTGRALAKLSFAVSKR
jgi:small-conductance mechanosensitive channel